MSDFHSRTNYATEQDVVLRAFFKDLAAEADARAVDLILVTGDVAFSGEPDQYQLATDHFLTPLMEAARITDRRRVVLVPGNHDVQRGKINEYEDVGLRQKLVTMEATNELLDDLDALSGVTKRVSSWINFVRDFYGNDEGESFCGLYRQHSVDIDGAKVAVAALNTAWRSSGDHDEGYLIVGDRIVKAAAKAAIGHNLAIAAMHHPPSWLAPFDARQLTLGLESSFHILATGHLHEPDPVGVDRPGGAYVHSVAGSLYGDDGRKWANSYTVLNLDLAARSIEVSIRDYQSKREEFDKAVSVAKDGQATFRLPSAALAGMESIGTPFDLPAQDYLSIRERSAQEIATWVREQSVINPPTDNPQPYMSPAEALALSMVEPYFQRVPREEMLSRTERQPIATDDVLADAADSTLIISGDGGTGITSALAWTLVHASDREPRLFPILLHAGSDVQAGQHAFVNACRKALRVAGISASNPALPPMLIAVNDTDRLVGKKLDRLAEFVSANPKSKFILGCRSDRLEAVTRVLKHNEIAARVVHLGPLGRRHVRDLVRKVVPAQDEERVLKLVAQLAGNTFSGRAPFIVAALVSLAAAQESMQSITDSISVTRSYAEMLLGRSDRFENSRVNMTYRNREHILQHVAAKLLLDGDTGVISRADLERYLTEYFTALDWYQSPAYVVDDLVARWVLFEVRPGEFAFRQKAMHSFFAAGHTMEDQSFRAYVLDDPFRWSVVIEYMAGLPKNDEDLLTSLYERLPESPSRTGVFNIKGEEIVVDESATFDDLVDDDSVGAESNGQELDDDAFDPLVLGSSSFELANPTAGVDATFLNLEWVRLVSNVLRSSELVENTELKRRIFRSLVVRWGDTADALATSLGIFFEENSESLEELFKEFDVDIDVARNLASEMAALMGIALALYGSVDSLASIKLDNALAPLTPADEMWKDPAAALIATALHADARAPKWSKYARDLLAEHGNLEAVRVGLVLIALAVIRVSANRKDRDDAEDLFVKASLRNMQFKDNNLRGLAEAALLRRIRLFGRFRHEIES